MRRSKRADNIRSFNEGKYSIIAEVTSQIAIRRSQVAVMGKRIRRISGKGRNII